MKNIFKWAVYISSSVILLFLLSGFGIYLYYNGFKPEYSSGGLLSENQASFDVTYYDINLEVLLESEQIAGNTLIKLISVVDNLDLLEIDLINNYQVDSVLINNYPSKKFIHQRDKLWITLPNAVLKNEMVIINIFYSGSPPVAVRPPWQGGFTWDEDDDGNAWVSLSCQGEGAKIWFPCKDHPSDEPDSAAINITVPEKYFVAANGILKTKSTPREGYKTFHWFTQYPINNYLINFGVGVFEIVKGEYIAEKGLSVPVVYYVLPQKLDGANGLVDQTIDILTSYRKFFGEYPWVNEKCALMNTPFAGMEHQTLIAYGNDYQFSKINGFSYDELLLHELAHEWWGNKITVKDWSDFWIQEGIATYAECLYLLDKEGELAYHECMDISNRRIRNRKAIKSGNNIAAGDAYHSDIYSKGAAFMHSLRYVLGDSIFFSTLKEFATDSNYTYKNTVTTNDFLQLVNNNSGMDLTDLFDLYLSTTILPKIKIDSVATNTFEIAIPNIDFEIPMDVVFENKVERIYLGPEAIEIISRKWPQVDPLNWFLKDD